MKIVEIAFIGYPVTDLQRARRFYEGVLGLKESQFFNWGDHGWVEYDIGVGTLCIGNGLTEWKPSAGGGSVGLEVEDFDAAMTRIKSHGCPFVLEPVETPVCHMAVVSDPDGNSITIHRRKE